jgi:hypothetical protein|tara:strand:- start:182 stop:391 length:210 start_codon:yes stop_codon:yes gene_type:complete
MIPSSHYPLPYLWLELEIIFAATPVFVMLKRLVGSSYFIVLQDSTQPITTVKVVIAIVPNSVEYFILCS